MKEENKLKTIEKLFEGKEIRTLWDADKEEYYFSVVDVIYALTDSKNPRDYWYKLKIRMSTEEKSQLSTNCRQLKMQSSDGKFYNTDTLDTEGIFRLIQSIPSPKAEPFKLWLAKVGNERVDETFDPEIGFQRLINIYLRKGYSRDWIKQRLITILNRNILTEAWSEHGIEKEIEFAILTNEIYKTWSDFTAKEYKQYKNLTKESLRDNMTNTELALNNLAEVATKEIIDVKTPYGLDENKTIAKEGGEVAKNARIDLENRLGKSVISSKNAKDINLITEKKAIKN